MTKTCTVCGQMKKCTDMSRSPAIVCKDCFPTYRKQRTLKQNREYQTKNRQKLKPYIRTYQEIHAEKIRERKRGYNKKYYAEHHKKKQEAVQNGNMQPVQP